MVQRACVLSVSVSSTGSPEHIDYESESVRSAEALDELLQLLRETAERRERGVLKALLPGLRFGKGQSCKS